MDAVLSLLDTYGVALLFVVMLLKEVGAPIPVPGDLLMIVAGARSATGTLPLWGVLLATLIAGFVGGFAQYLLARGPGRGFIYRFGKYVGLTPARLDKASAAVKGRGWVAVALGRALPGLRIGAVAACGLAAVPTATFALGLFAGTVLFVGFHTMLGYLAGPGVTALLDGFNVPVWVLLLVLVLVGLAGWLILRSRKRKARADGETAAIFDWADACCPACLAAAALERRLVGPPTSTMVSNAA
ncbi:MAG TPA: DedA family protein [Chloroflexia bacterium]|nr:DedA family protein [Chloroflexia bacterium]